MEKPNLNVFKYGYLKAHSFEAIKHNIGQFFRNIKYAYQRATKGFCDFDRWDLDVFYTKLLIESLSEFKERSHSYPGFGPLNSEEKWDAYLDEIIVRLGHCFADEENGPNADKEREKAFRMLSSVWRQLWD